MRYLFGKWLHEQAKKDPKLHLLVGDIGYGVFDDFRRDFPDRFLNCGTCEQTMVGVAAGMALQGLHPYVYTITPFLIERAFEQIKLDIAAQQANVKLVGYADYPTQGVTHQEVGGPKLMSMVGVNSFFPRYHDSCMGAFKTMARTDRPCFVSLKKMPERRPPLRVSSNLFLASFPKSGNTWVKMVLGGLIAGRPLKSIKEANDLIDWGDNEYNLTKTHAPAQKVQFFNRAVYLVRHPCACIASWRRDKHEQTGEWIDDLKAYEAEYGDWETHVLGWRGGGWYQGGEAMIVWYEDMLARPEMWFRTIARWFGLPSEPPAAPRDATKVPDASKFWRQKPDLWKSELPESLQQEIRTKYARGMKEMGYQ